MCVINWRPEHWGEVESTPRSMPRLAWVAPVDVLDLRSSIEAYERQLPTINTLRLCHRFGDSPLSQLPQEILDHVISDVHLEDKAEIKAQWDQHFACYHGDCTTGQHLDPMLIEEIWDLVCEALWDDDESADPGSFSDEERTRMVVEHMDNHPYGYDEYVWDTHDQMQTAWLDLFCTCRQPTAPNTVPKFARLNKLLKDHFGVEAIVLHEVLSTNLQQFLPIECRFSDCSYYTSGFLALAAPNEVQSTTHGRSSAHSNAMFLGNNNHLAFHQTVDPAQFILTEKQRLRFARALRILGLQPEYHLSELETNIDPSNQEDDALWAICDAQLAKCPAPLKTSKSTKKKALQQHVHSKNKELAKRPWPQLQLMATSDAVGPSYS